ncbi:MAG: hypothetical protein NTW19_02640 [Planctomycetota bacterium]|nr:hypothetical protein [Planctomycetota bacterium]
MLRELQPGKTALRPFVIRSCEIQGKINAKNRSPKRSKGGDRLVDAMIEVSMPGESRTFWFVVECKSRSTPEAVEMAIAKARAASSRQVHPMIQVPFLGPDRLEHLQAIGVSGVDLCGNGVMIVPGRAWVVHTGHPNQYRESRPLQNPFRGQSGLVARALAAKPHWDDLTSLLGWMAQGGAKVSQPQASKAVRALKEELIVAKQDRKIELRDPERLLDKIASQWRPPEFHKRSMFRLPANDDGWSTRLSSDPRLRWAVTGGSSVSRYVMFAQGGPRRIAVSDLAAATALLRGIAEPIPGFADVELVESQDSELYFLPVVDEAGVRWAGRLQTWLELQAGDARQREAARDIRGQILKEMRS